MGNDDMMVNWWLTANQPWLTGTSSSKMINMEVYRSENRRNIGFSSKPRVMTRGYSY
jgi:hypothetical protein